MDILLACAAEVEGRRISARFPEQTVVLGVGKASAAANVTRRCLEVRPDAVVLFGVCGAYPKGHGGAQPPVDVGDLVLVEQDRFGDEGVVVDKEFLTVGDLELGSDLPFLASADLLGKARAALPSSRVVRGATVSSCSGSDDQSRRMATRTGAHVESMEGAAVALACAQLDIPWLQVRCVSNRTGHREAGGWDLAGSVARVQTAVIDLMGVWGQ